MLYIQIDFDCPSDDKEAYYNAIHSTVVAAVELCACQSTVIARKGNSVCDELARQRDDARAERDDAYSGRRRAWTERLAARGERDDMRVKLNTMTADRDFVIVERDRARRMVGDIAALPTVPRHAWDGLMADAREMRAALLALTHGAHDARMARARAIIERTDCLTDTDNMPYNDSIRASYDVPIDD